MNAVTIKELQSINSLNVPNVERITECAHSDRGYGHYVLIQSSDKKRAAQGVEYHVDVDLQYRVLRCWKYTNGQRDGLCPQFEHKGACKHTREVARMYAPQLYTLRNDTINPIVSVIRKNEAGKFFLTQVRQSQLSADECRAIYAAQFVY